MAGTPAGRPLFVPPGVPGTPGRCPEDFSSVYVPLSRLSLLGLGARWRDMIPTQINVSTIQGLEAQQR